MDHSEVLGVAQGYPITISYSEVLQLSDATYQIVRNYLRNADVASDTSSDLVLSWLTAAKEGKQWAMKCLESEPYLRRFAEHGAQHAAEQMRAHQAQPMSIDACLNTAGMAYLSNPQLLPDREAIRRDLAMVMYRAVSRLQDRPRHIFIRRHYQLESVVSIAESLQCTRNAVSVSLVASRSQIIKYLLADGHTQADLHEYLYFLFIPD